MIRVIKKVIVILVVVVIMILVVITVVVVMVAVMRHTNEHTPLCASAAPKVKSPGGLTLLPISASDYDFL